MARLVVDNLEEEVRQRLRELARHHGRTEEEEAREIIREAVAAAPAADSAGPGLGTRLVALFSGSGIGLTDEESKAMDLRGRLVLRPVDFDR